MKRKFLSMLLAGAMCLSAISADNTMATENADESVYTEYSEPVPEETLTEEPVAEAPLEEEQDIPEETQTKEIPEEETPPEETPNESFSESEKEELTDVSEETETEEEDAVPDVDLSLYNLADFASLRILVMTDYPDVILKSENIIGQFDNIYLLSYDEVEDAVEHYAYYQTKAEAVEPDAVIGAADGEYQDGDYSGMDVNFVTEDDNPVDSLNNVSAVSLNTNSLIALIDSGVSYGENLVASVSLIDDALSGGEHGDAMYNAIIEQNPDAQILSVRVMDNNGYGTVSSIVSGIEYAMESGAEIINLSMFSRKTLSSEVLSEEIQKASDGGIILVGAAGNAGDDAVNYVPACVDVANLYIIGACSNQGNRIGISNYGSCVDYYIVGNNTSEAAAAFSGYISRFGISGLPDWEDCYIEVGEPGEDVEFDGLDPYYESYIRNNLNTSLAGDGEMTISYFLRVKQALVDSDISSSATLDSVMHGDDIAHFLAMLEGVVAVYDCGGSYYVAYADTLHQDGSTVILDHVMANDNSNGEDYNDYIFDSASGLVYIPKGHFDTDGDGIIDNSNQIEFVQLAYGSDYFSFGSGVTILVSEGEKIYTSSASDNMFDMTTNVTVGQGLDTSSMVVCINGIPLDPSSYNYDTNSGNLSLNFSSGVVQSVSILTDGETEDSDIVSSAYTYAEMPAFNTTETAVPGDWDSLEELGSYLITYQIKYDETGTYVMKDSKAYLLGDSKSGEGDARSNTYSFVSGESDKLYENLIPIAGNLTGYATFASKLGTIEITDDLNTSENDTFDFDFSVLGDDDSVIHMACAHIADPAWDTLEYDTVSESVKAGLTKNYGTIKGMMRVLHKTDEYAIISIIAQTVHGQNGWGIIKLYITPKPHYPEFSLDLTKKEADTDKVLGNAVFKLEFWDKNSNTSENADNTWYFMTDEDGKIVIDNTMESSAHLIDEMTFSSERNDELKGLTIKSDAYPEQAVAAGLSAVTEENGSISSTSAATTVSAFRFGTYRISEIAAPDGYKAEGTISSVDGTVNADVKEGLEFVLSISDDGKGTKCTIGENEVSSSMVYTATDKPYTNKLIIRKKTDQGSVTDVQFTLYNKTSGEYVTGERGDTFTMNADGTLEISDLPNADYVLSEVATADGNNLLAAPVEFSLPHVMTLEEAKEKDVDISAESCYYNEEKGEYCFTELTLNINNNATLKVPMTGGTPFGMYLFAVLTAVLLAVGTIGFYRFRIVR